MQDNLNESNSKIHSQIEHYTNNILEEKSPKETIYYFPAYMSFKVKNFVEMDLGNLAGSINGVILFSVYYGGLDEEIVDQLKKKVVLMFNRDDALQLKSEDDDGKPVLEVRLNEKKSERMLTFTVRKVFNAKAQPQIFLTPFQIINLVLSITVQSFSFKDTKNTKITCRFNLMDHPIKTAKIGYTSEGAFGTYDLAERLLQACFTNSRSPKFDLNNFAQKDELDKKPKLKHQQSSLPQSNQESEAFVQKVKYFQYAHFKIPLYKHPSVSLATIFIPLWLLGIINLAIFFQSSTLDNRLGTIATLMIAFVALIPTIRDSLPPNPSITFVQILVYLESFTSLLCLIDSFLIRGQDSTTYQMDYATDGYFLASLIITILSILLICGLMVIHKLWWEPRYNIEGEGKDIKLVKNEWSNRACDEYYSDDKFINRITKVQFPQLEKEEQKLKEKKNKMVKQTADKEKEKSSAQQIKVESKQ